LTEGAVEQAPECLRRAPREPGDAVLAELFVDRAILYAPALG